MAKQDGIVAEYLLELAPETLLRGLRQLAAVEYPVDDAKALEEQLEDNDCRQALSWLQPQDFPLVGARNAFDKLIGRIGIGDEIPSIPELVPETEFTAPQERPSPGDIYEDTFSSPCAARASAAYAQALRQGFNDLQALLIGHGEGRRCQAELGRRLWEWPRPPRPPRIWP